MTGTDNPNADPAWREKITDVLRHWEAVGVVDPAWNVEYATGEGAYRITYILRATWDERPRKYILMENEFCERIIALADTFPEFAGRAGVALADETREEHT